MPVLRAPWHGSSTRVTGRSSQQPRTSAPGVKQQCRADDGGRIEMNPRRVAGGSRIVAENLVRRRQVAWLYQHDPRFPRVIRRVAQNAGLAVGLLLVAAWIGVSTVAPAFAGAIIDNGTVQLGINDAGHLIAPSGTTDVGLRYIPSGGEVLAHGCLCEGWGVAGKFDSGDGLVSFAGYAQRERGGEVSVGVVGLDVQSGTGPVGSLGNAFKSIVRTSNGLLEITHDF